ncbi:hypothetical protein JCM8547_005038 [Rhodosporidiobolus lusitaniae]
MEVPPTTLPADQPLPENCDPPVVAHALNYSLVMRRNSGKKEARVPLVRPYLATFLEYVCGVNSTTKKPRFVPAIHSSIRKGALLELLTTLDLVPAFQRPFEGRMHDFVPNWRGRSLGQRDKGTSFGDAELPKDLSLVWQNLDLAESGNFRGELSIQEKTILDTVGAKRTVLLDDSTVSAALQPHSYLKLDEFVLPEDHPLGKDDRLLITICLLERLRRETNISYVLKNNFVDKVRDEIKSDARAIEGKELTVEEVDAVLADKGRRVCERFGIEVRRDWDGQWRTKMLDKEGLDFPEIPATNVLPPRTSGGAVYRPPAARTAVKEATSSSSSTANNGGTGPPPRNTIAFRILNPSPRYSTLNQRNACDKHDYENFEYTAEKDDRGDWDEDAYDQDAFEEKVKVNKSSRRFHRF